MFESSGSFKQNQLIFNVNSRLSSKITLFGFYAYSHAHTDVLGQPSNPYDFAADWGRSSYDIRHRVNIIGSIVLPFGLRLSPNISANSGPPFNITSGVDEFGDFQFNTRPALLPSGSSAPSGCVSSSAGSPLTSAGALANTGACVVFLTKYGNFVVNPPAQSNLKPIPADFGSGFAQISVNMRISRTWGIR